MSETLLGLIARHGVRQSYGLMNIESVTCLLSLFAQSPNFQLFDAIQEFEKSAYVEPNSKFYSYEFR